MSDPLKPSVALLAKLGSIAAHVEEGVSKDGHPFDTTAAMALLTDPEVREWMQAMRKLSFLPQPRTTHD